MILNSFALPVYLALGTSTSTLLGGACAIRLRRKLPLIMGFTAGVLLGVVSFDLLPEIMRQLRTQDLAPTGVMAALAGGFLLFHVLEKLIVIHHSDGCVKAGHKHSQVGVLSALALIAHSVMDGVSIGLGFQVSRSVGVVVAAAVIAHDFVDGANTVVVMLSNDNTPRRAATYLMFDALAPTLGLAATLFFHPMPSTLTLYLGFLAGFILYIGASHILPEAHSQRSSISILALTVLGAVLAFVLSAVV